MNIVFIFPNQNTKSCFIKEVHMLKFENMFNNNKGIIEQRISLIFLLWDMN